MVKKCTKEIKIYNKHTLKYSVPLVIKEMPIKYQIRFSLMRLLKIV